MKTARTIAAVVAATALVVAAAATAASADGSPSESSTWDGKVTVVVDDQPYGDDGERVDVAAWLAAHPAVAKAVADIEAIGDGDTRVDVAAWIAAHETVSDAEWWDLERRLLRAVIEGD